MKTNYYLWGVLIVLCAFITFSSCSKENVEPTPTLDKTSITLYVNETSVLTYSGKDCKWSTDNYLIAEVDNGKVTANHVGTTTIHANNLTCEVIVKPRHYTYTEPYINFGCSKEEVKKIMINYNFRGDNGKYLTYEGKGKVSAYIYDFENNALTTSSFYVTLINSLDLSDFLLERYWVVDVAEGSSNEYIITLGSVDLKTAIFMELSSSTGAIILYKDFNELKNKLSRSGDSSQNEDKFREAYLKCMK